MEGSRIVQAIVFTPYLMSNTSKINRKNISLKGIGIMTPCVGICSTSIAGSVCRGCKRYAHEVIRWNAYSESERQIVWKRLEEFRITIMSRWLEVFDEALLQEKLIKRKVKFNKNLNSKAWAYDLLRAGASQIKALEKYGLELLPCCQQRSVNEVFAEIEKEYMMLSEAHYSRYFLDVRNT